MDFKIKKVSDSDLCKNGFRLEHQGHGTDNSIYVKTIPVWRYNEIPVLFARISVALPSKDVAVDVYTTSWQIYAPFYTPDDHCSHKNMLRKIDRAIERELNFAKS